MIGHPRVFGSRRTDTIITSGGSTQNFGIALEIQKVSSIKGKVGELKRGPWLSVQCSDIKYIHIVVQLSPLFSRTFSSSQKDTLYPLNNIYSLLPSAPGNLYSAFCVCKYFFSIYLFGWLVGWLTGCAGC